ncbi:MAG: hypothetical protein IPL19_14760 [Sandaracinaceae bacterium]|nr:hypothetical protein [Sandaracinaceae bacterium]
MIGQEDDKARVQSELEDLKEHAKATSKADLESGAWFPRLLRMALETYSREVNAEFFFRKYPGLPADAIAERRIHLAQRYAMIEGGLTATAYTAAIAATIGSGGGASPLTLPGALLTFTIDLMYVTRLQLRLAYDLATLYGTPVDINDPEDLYDVIRVAFGIKAGEALRGALPRMAPEAARQGVKAVIKGPVLAALQALPVVGQYLLQRNIVKFAVPVIGIPLSMKLNHYMTGRVGKLARTIYRDKAAIQEMVHRLPDHVDAEASLLLRAVWFVVNADQRVEAEEAWMLKSLVAHLAGHDGTAAAIADFRAMVNLKEDALFREMDGLDPSTAAVIFDFACTAAIVDRNLADSETAALQKLADALHQEFDTAALRKRAKHGVV